MVEKIHKRKTFLKYNVVALSATAADFLVLIFLTEVLNLWYLISAIIGSTTGGILAFFLERNWTFKKKDKRIRKQAFRYIQVWVGSIFLNTALLYVFVDCFHVQYIISKVIVAIFVSVFFNFFAHKYYIFR